MNDATQQTRRPKLWVMAVLALSLPATAFVLSHSLVRFDRALPDWLGAVLSWTSFFTGMLGALSTLGAVVVAVIASLLGNMPVKAKVLMWSFVAVSLLALVYLAQVSP